MNYTKGEWRIHKSLPDDIIYSETDEGIVNLARIRHQEVPEQAQEANAHLIATAPDMYEALKAIIEECPDPQLPYGKAVVRIATEALAKAEGK